MMQQYGGQGTRKGFYNALSFNGSAESGVKWLGKASHSPPLISDLLPHVMLAEKEVGIATCYCPTVPTA
jgi:hypothetical protein